MSTGTATDASGALHTGTMTLRSVGKQDPSSVVPDPDDDGPWIGTRVILIGTGELERVHGHRTSTGPSLDLEGRIHAGG